MNGGKAKNLLLLDEIVGITVPRFIVIKSQENEVEISKKLDIFLKTIPCDVRLAVRSSASQEDLSEASFAGMYTTKLNVSANVDDLLSAIASVRGSVAEKDGVLSHYVEQKKLDCGTVKMSVIVQEFVEADYSGVIFSHDLNKMDGYYTISISEGVGEHIVGGSTNGKLIRIVRGSNAEDITDKNLKLIVDAMQKVEQAYDSRHLDVEFAIKDNEIFILQCRPITTGTFTEEVQGSSLICSIGKLNDLVASEFRGDVLGDMIDINPLELLGTNPTALDVSIFKYLFADKVVEQVRSDMGYNPLHIGLMRVVNGKPYISMRASAFSFRPSGIPELIYDQLVRVYHNILVRQPSLQSSVEFNVYAMSTGEKLEEILRHTYLDDDEKQIVRDAFVRIDSTFYDVSEKCLESFESDVVEYEYKIDTLDMYSLEDMLRHVVIGTKIFVQVARLAFYWKNRFEELYPQENLNELMRGYMKSMSLQLQSDLFRCRTGQISRNALVRKYGHLRPGQFSVFGESYADDPELYLFSKLSCAKPVEIIELKHNFKDKIEFKNLISFMNAREQMKFLFSRALNIFINNLQLELVKKGITKDSASNMQWSQLSKCLKGCNCGNIEDDIEQSIILPSVIIPGVTDLSVVVFNEAMPSYITNLVVKARLCAIEQFDMDVDVHDTIVLLPNADPGYDFLFHSGALGIITKVGGPASHMCIRAIELQMPACIGCGENMYRELIRSEHIVLDCASEQIIIS